jgi:hypothetical protein
MNSVLPMRESSSDEPVYSPAATDSAGMHHSVRKLETCSHTGLQIGDRIMMYSKDGRRHGDTFSIDTGTVEFGVKVLIMDVNAGLWEVRGEGFQQRLSVSKEGGFLFFKADSGIYEMKFIST